MFKIKNKQKRKNTIVQTIRFSGDSYDKLQELAYENGISFNNLVNQIIEYVLKEM
jgi:predicted DNA-binding protein